MDSGGNTVLMWLCYSSPFIKWSEELPVWGGPRITGLQQVSAAGQVALHWGHMMQQIPQCLKDHWQTGMLCEPSAGPHVESQCGTRMWEQDPTSSPDNHSPFKRQFLACYWASNQMLDHRLPSYHETWAAHHKPSVIWPIEPWSWACTATHHCQMEAVCIWPGSAGREGTGKTYEAAAQILMVPLLLRCLCFLPLPAPAPMQSVIWEEEEVWIWLTDGSARYTR